MYIEADVAWIYVAFVCVQNVPIVAEQHTNNSGTGSDDYVSVKLWPGGKNGVAYSFSATAIGTHDQSSSENTAFSPQWASFGKVGTPGYTVVLRIPRYVLHGDGRHDWPIQFERVISKESLDLVWAWDPAMTSATDPTFAGLARGIAPTQAVTPKARARFQPYVLAQTNARQVGGSASRAGIDFSIPITNGSSFYGTIHPDYSEVERDQQTIAPTEFAYRYAEVRPFFTQGATYFDATTLYTPAIPTPRYGYAIEGAEHDITYAAFNAVGLNGRDDNASVVSWLSNNRTYGAAFQRVSVDYPGFHDVTDSVLWSLGNAKHFTLYGTLAQEHGSTVSDPSKGRYDSVSFDLYGPNKNLLIQRNDYGALFTPADSYVSYVDAHGYTVSAYDQLNFSSPGAKFNNLTFSYYADRYVNSRGEVNQTDSIGSLSIATKKQLQLAVFFDVTHGLDATRGIVPYNQSGFSFFDGADPRKNGGASYQFGQFYNGYLRNFSPYISFKIGAKEAITLSESRYVFTSTLVGREVEQLDSLSYSFQYSKYGSLVVGARLISGSQAYFFPIPPVYETNLTASVNQRFSNWHIYFVYGDPNALTTSPTVILKIVRFIGGEEGT